MKRSRKKKPETPKVDDAYWLPRTAVIKAFGVKEQTYERNIKPLIPVDAIRKNEKGRVFIHCRRLIEAWADHKRGIPAAATTGLREKLDELELRKAEASVAMRETSAEIRRMNLQERKGEVVSIERMNEGFNRLGSILAALRDQLQRACGREAAEILNEGLDDWFLEMKEVLGVG